MYILGINAAFHDSSACLLKDGNLVAAAEEERFTQIKHGKRPVPFSAYELPYHAINYCLETAGIKLKEVDKIAYSFNPALFTEADLNQESIQLPLKAKEENANPGTNPYDPLFLSYIMNAPAHLTDGYPHHLQHNFAGSKESQAKWVFIDHHRAHAASAYYPSPYNEAAVWVIDGRGERTTTSYWHARDEGMRLMSEVSMPHSLGLLYEQVTTYLGFLHSSDEYKVMALASFGKPVHLDYFKSKIHILPEGKYTIDPLELEKNLGPARKREEPFLQQHFDIAYSLQKVLEETVLQLADWLFQATKSENLVMAGGVALNCVMNAVLRDEGPFKNIWVQPAAGDAGTALGAALCAYFDETEEQHNRFRMQHVYWGPGYSDEEIEKFLKMDKSFLPENG